MKELNELFERIFASEYLKTVFKIVFAAKRKKSVEFERVNMRPLMLRDNLMIQVEKHTENKVFHENLMVGDAMKMAFDLIEKEFKQLNVIGQSEEIQVLASKVDNPRITINGKDAKNEPAVKLEHDRKKEYILEDGLPCDFLVELGVMNKSGSVFHKHYGKFRQINRYLEIVDDIFNKKPELLKNERKKLRVIDFGCGKSYLTFALYHYLSIIKGYDVEITGLDLKKSVIEFCKKLAEKLSYDKLNFEVGDIKTYRGDKADIVVSLHACDTATDYALENAVNWGAKVILSVPCCQHELFSQIENELHFPMLKHGILKDKFTEIFTDALRGLILEACGYNVDMIEFTSLEHTSKNVMIRAIFDEKRTKADMAKALKEYNKLKEFYNVSPSTDLLAGEVRGWEEIENGKKEDN